MDTHASELKHIKQSVAAALARVGLSSDVSLDEIETELLRVDTAFQSLLMLGIMRRIMHCKDDEAAKLFIPSVTEWKNYFPHKDLDGLSPAEMMKKYPLGPSESVFVSEMMNAYDARLRRQGIDDSLSESFDIESDFLQFQDEYLNRIPAAQPTPIGNAGRLMTIKEIIVAERRKEGHPEKNIDKIGAKIFAENTAEGAGDKMAALEDGYVVALEELARMQNSSQKLNKKRVREIRQQFEREEPYHRCSPMPHQFFLNYAGVILLDDKHAKDKVLFLLDRSLAYKPDYAIALDMKRNIDEYFE